MTCIRADGSFTRADLGPGLPFHDLCHYVVERAFGLKAGSFGHVASGYSLDSLSRKEVILNLEPESWQAEIVARAEALLTEFRELQRRYQALPEGAARS
jgi:hypothetical protein